MIDWNLALSTGKRLSKPGPEVGPGEVAEAVAELREGAARSEAPVREFSDLHAVSATAPVLVVDRPRWIEANIGTFEVLMNPVVGKLARSNKLSNGVTRSIGEKVSGAEVGALMAFMSSRVLGQFDPFWTGPDGEGGRLLLVAPNIVQAERQLDVDPSDFRLWVCLHEETHRVQFTAVPWMRQHLRSLIDDFVEATDLDASKLSALVSDGFGEIVRIARGDSEASLGELLQNEEQRRIGKMFLVVLMESLDVLSDLQELIRRTLVDEPPVSLADGGAVRVGVDEELDELRGLSTSGRERIAAIEERERAREVRHTVSARGAVDLIADLLNEGWKVVRICDRNGLSIDYEDVVRAWRQERPNV